jgi:ribonuclease P protein component
MLRTRRDFASLQGSSRSKVHPLLAVRFARNDLGLTRAGFSTGRRLGGAVVRNRVRRRLRAALRDLAPRVEPGWDLLVVARPAAVQASYTDLRATLERLLRGEGLIGRATEPKSAEPRS